MSKYSDSTGNTAQSMDIKHEIVLPSQDPLHHSKKHLLPWVIALALFIDMLDSTIVSVAIPRIADSFGINPVDMKLALTSYLLSLAIFIPISGWIADRYGEKRIFILAVVIFTVSSILCAASPSLTLLTIARMIQGFGGALMMPVGRLIMLRNFSKAEFAQAMSLVVIPGLIGPALGPTLGGLILYVASWHWIFLINVPLGLMEAIIAYYIIVPSKPQTTTPFNWSGFLLFSLGLSSCTFALALLGDKFSLYQYSLILGACSLMFLLFYWQVSIKQKNPLLDMTLFKQKTFAISIIVTLIARPCAGATPFLMPLLLQVVWGKDALFSGIMFMFLALGMLCARFVFKQTLLIKYGFRKVLMVCVICLSFLSMNLCWFSKPQPLIYLAILLFMMGAFTTQFYSCIGVMSVIEVPPEKFSQTTSMTSIAQQFAIGCGVAIAAIILHLISQLTHTPLFSYEVFFWTFIILNSFALLAVFFILQLNPKLKLTQDQP